MTTFSARARHIIDQAIGEYTRPLCLILDHDFIVKAWSGDCSYYGFDDIEEGKDCRDSMLFMVGMDPPQDSIHLQFIETPNARSVHLQLFAEPEALVLVLLDATEQRINHEAIQQKGYELAILHVKQLKLISNLKSLERELAAKRRQAEQANLLKGRFIATMSHEFRTPLTSILGYSARLKQRDDFDPTALKYLGSVERGALHLLSLVENLLDQSQIEVDSLTINPMATNINIVVDKLCSIFEPLAEDKHLDLRFDRQPDIPEYLFLDEMRFRQILVNLISNAIKFTEQGSISLDINWADETLVVYVEDTGKGIAEADQERVFNAFEQLGNHPGAGLGLSIVKHLVTAMGGSITLSSSLGKGTRFEVVLPAKQVKIDPNEYRKELKELNLKKKLHLRSVLLVEDDPDIMGLLLGMFEDVDYPVLIAGNGNDAIQIALSEWPDLILLDLHLPDMTGFEVIKTLRSNNFHNPVFAQSAWASSEHKAKAIAAGCDEYLVKPLDIVELKTLISDYFIDATDPGILQERLQKLQQKFLESLPEKKNSLQQLEVNGATHNWDSTTRQDLHYFAHRLAGSAGLYGMHAIAKAAMQLDELLRNYETLQAQDDTAELREKITSIIAMLGRQIQQAITKG